MKPTSPKISEMRLFMPEISKSCDFLGKEIQNFFTQKGEFSDFPHTRPPGMARDIKIQMIKNHGHKNMPNLNTIRQRCAKFIRETWVNYEEAQTIKANEHRDAA